MANDLPSGSAEMRSLQPLMMHANIMARLPPMLCPVTKILLTCVGQSNIGQPGSA